MGHDSANCHKSTFSSFQAFQTLANNGFDYRFQLCRRRSSHRGPIVCRTLPWVRAAQARRRVVSCRAATCVRAAIPAAGRQALLDIYAATSGANWERLATWTGVAGSGVQLGAA